MDNEKQKQEVIDFLENTYTGAKMMGDEEVMLRASRALLAFNGNSKGYMQIYEKWHTERMEAEGVTDLFNPYQNIRVGLNCLREIQDKYLASSGENCVLMVYNMGESTAKKLWAKDIYSSAYSREVIARAQELRQELTQE